MDSLKKVSMEEFANSKIGDLSGGQRQRVFIARAFVQILKSCF
jgi:zinc transport system ATP-binding protein